MKMTSAQAAKLLKQLNEQHSTLRLKEDNSKSFLAALGEDIESARPEYDYNVIQEQLAEIELKIRKLKHAINIFNATTVIPEFNIAIDEMLVYLPQLTSRANKLSKMKNVMPKTRENSLYSRGSLTIGMLTMILRALMLIIKSLPMNLLKHKLLLMLLTTLSSLK